MPAHTSISDTERTIQLRKPHMLREDVMASPARPALACSSTLAMTAVRKTTLSPMSSSRRLSHLLACDTAQRCEHSLDQILGSKMRAKLQGHHENEERADVR